MPLEKRLNPIKPLASLRYVAKPAPQLSRSRIFDGVGAYELKIDPAPVPVSTTPSQSLKG
jgi:hypothetical protein